MHGSVRLDGYIIQIDKATGFSRVPIWIWLIGIYAVYSILPAPVGTATFVISKAIVAVKHRDKSYMTPQTVVIPASNRVYPRFSSCLIAVLRSACQPSVGIPKSRQVIFEAIMHLLPYVAGAGNGRIIFHRKKKSANRGKDYRLPPLSASASDRPPSGPSRFILPSRGCHVSWLR